MTTNEMTNEQSESQSVSVLAALWQSRKKTLFGGVEKPLTPKEFGQLKLLRKSLGDVTSRVIDWALNNWRLFSYEVRVQAGLSCAPATPHIGFLLVYHAAAVNLMHTLAQNKTVKSAADISVTNKIDELIAKQKQELEEQLSVMSEQ